MPHMLHLNHPRRLIQQNRPPMIPRKTPIEESPGLLESEFGVFGERDAEDGAEFFEA